MKIATSTEDINNEFYVIGVGTSADGFEAFSVMLVGFEEMPNMCVIIVQHLS